MKINTGIFKLTKRLQNAYWDLVSCGIVKTFSINTEKSLSIILNFKDDTIIKYYSLYLTGADKDEKIIELVKSKIHKSGGLNFYIGIVNTNDPTVFHITIFEGCLNEYTTLYRKLKISDRAKERIAIHIAIAEDELLYSMLNN